MSENAGLPMHVVFLLLLFFFCVDASSWTENHSHHNPEHHSNLSVFKNSQENLSRAGNHSHFEVGRYTEEQAHGTYLACRAVCFCLLALCTVGNGLNLVVLIRSVPTWRTSACHYLIATAVADLLALWLGVFVDFLSEKGVRRSYKALGMWFFLPWLSEASMILSDWTLVVFSWERLRVILSPFRFGFLQRVATARILIVVIVILSLACFMHEFAYAYCNWVNRPSGPSYNPTAYAWVHSWHRLHNLALLVVRIFTFVLILIPGVILIAFLARQRQSEFVERVARKTQGIRETCQHRPASLCRNTESTSSC